MNIIPSARLENIQTGNPYQGRGGLVDLCPEHTILEVAKMFPFHKVDVISGNTIRSHVLDGQVRVYYNNSPVAPEFEILSPYDDRYTFEVFLGDVQVFGKTLDKLKFELVKAGFELKTTDFGYELDDKSVDFYSHDYEGSLDIKLDAILMRF
ncbi:MAG: hypothetical protein ACPGGK_12505 [Pikeienuella sp.]